MTILDKIFAGEEITPQDVWGAYQDGVNYNELKQIRETVEENNNMYIGNQWEGLEVEGLPTVVANFIKPVTQHKVAAITSSKSKITIMPVGLVGKTTKEQKMIADIINKQLDAVLEREKYDKHLKLQTETACAVNGDACWHIPWDETINTGQDRPGDMTIELINNVNVFFLNTASAEVGKQPGIILERREYISSLKARAMNELGFDEMEVSSIAPDTDNQFVIDNDDNRVTVLIFYWRDVKTGKIKYVECTQTLMLQGETETSLTRYPVTWKNWEPRLNDYHGEPCVSEMVTNQITINKLLTMQAVSLSRTAFPTIVYNKMLLPGGWDNAVGAAIGIDMYEIKASDVAGVIEPANHSNELDKFSEMLLQITKNLNGANDSVLGDINPENTSAIMALIKTSTVPLELNITRNDAFLEDFARIALDYMSNYYGVRKVNYVDETGEEIIIDFNFDMLQGMAFNIKIEVGPSNQWGEVTEMQTLKMLYDTQAIDAIKFLKYLPEGVFANRNLLLDELTKEMKQMQFEVQQDSLVSLLQKDPELAAKVQQLKETDPAAYEQVIKSLNSKIQMQG